MDLASAFESALRAKGISRRQRAELPFESKIDILIRMQKLTARIGKVSGRKPAGKAWPVESEKKKTLSPKAKPGRVAMAVSQRRNRRSRKQE